MKRLVLLLPIVCLMASAQNLTRFAGIYNALDYAYGAPGSSPGSLKISVGNPITGLRSVTLDFGYTTLSDGTKIYPLSTNAPIMVGTETVIPTSTSCLSPTIYSTCRFEATFTQLHGPGDNVTSATYGLQEAINAAHTLGGAVVVDGKWVVAGGTSGMISGAALFGNTAIADNRFGQVFGGGAGGGLSAPGTNNVIVKYTNGLATTPALFADFAALLTGTPSSSTFARGDGVWAVPPGSSAVSSVFGRTGAVVAATADYNAAQVTNAASTAAPNTFGAFLQSFAASSVIIPKSAAAAPTVAGQIAYDTGSNTYQFGNGSVTEALAYFLGAPPAAGNCVQWGSGAYQLSSTGAPCASGSGSPVYALSSSSATQVIPGSFVDTKLLFDTNASFTTDPSIHSTSSNTDGFVAPASGLYQGACAVGTSTSNSGSTYVTVMLDDTTTIINTGLGTSTAALPNGTGWVLPWSYLIPAGHYVNCHLSASDGWTAGAGATFTFYAIH